MEELHKILNNLEHKSLQNSSCLLGYQSSGQKVFVALHVCNHVGMNNIFLQIPIFFCFK